MQNADRRKYERIGVALNSGFSKLSILDEPTYDKPGEVKNISAGGLFIETSNPLPEGILINLSFCLIGTNNRVRAEGLVRWSSFGRDETKQGMGIEFLSNN